MSNPKVPDHLRLPQYPRKLTPEKLAAFCAVLAETCNVGKACKAIEISRVTAYEWRKTMPEFAARWDAAMKVGVTALEDEAHRRAFEGVPEPVVHQGQFTELWEEVRDEEGEPVQGDDGKPLLRRKLDEQGAPMVASVRKYSDTLAIFLLKAHSPDKYRERSSVDLTAKVNINEMSEAEIAAELAALGVALPDAPANDASGQLDDSEDDARDLV